MASIPPLLRLPTEIRLRIAVIVIGDGPEPRYASKSDKIDTLALDCINKRYAIFEIPGFALHDEYPNAFAQGEAVVVAGYDWEDGDYFYCFGVTQVGQWPAVQVLPAEWSSDAKRAALWLHVPTPPTKDADSVTLITDELEASVLFDTLNNFFEGLVRPSYKTLKLCILVKKEEHKHYRYRERFYQILDEDAALVRAGLRRMLWFVEGNMPREADAVEHVKLEVYDQRNEAGRVIRIQYNKVDPRIRGRWTCEGGRDAPVMHEHFEK